MSKAQERKMMTLGIFNPWSDDMEDISNRGLSKLFSVEVLGSLLGGALLAGVIYQSLASDVQQATVKVEKVEEQVGRTKDDVGTIKTDLAVVKTTQGHLQDDIEKQGEQLEEIDQDVKQILRILSETYID